MMTETIGFPRAFIVASVAPESASRSGIVSPGERTNFDFCDVLAAGLGKPANGSSDRYTYDAPVIHGRAPPNANILSRCALYRYLGTR
jgi:hypothetical protein